MNNSNDQIERDPDFITIKDIIQLIKDYSREVLNKWWIVMLFTIPIVGYQVYKALNTPLVYNAQMRFIVEGDSGNQLAGLGGLLGSFGISGGGKVNPYKILEVAKSKVIMENVLFDSTTYTDKFVINEIMDLYKLDEQWAEIREDFRGYRFKSSDESTFRRLDKRAFKKVLKVVLGTKKDRENALLRIALDKDSGIYTLTTKSLTEDLSLDLSNKTFDMLKVFFEDRIFDQQKLTRDLLQAKKDSLKQVINLKSIELANYQDRNRGAITSAADIKIRNLQSEIAGVAIAFQETYKNLEVSDFTLKNSKPLFLEIDRAYPPLTAVGPSLIINIIIGLFLGGILSVIFIILRKLIVDAV